MICLPSPVILKYIPIKPERNELLRHPVLQSINTFEEIFKELTFYTPQSQCSWKESLWGWSKRTPSNDSRQKLQHWMKHHNTPLWPQTYRTKKYRVSVARFENPYPSYCTSYDNNWRSYANCYLAYICFEHCCVMQNFYWL